MPGAAPSRSTLKLAEAFHIFLGDRADACLQAEMRAVDLGAAPGGWTWQLMNRGMKVIAVDNGALKGDVVDNAMVRHVRADGFKFVPDNVVDWMVCDMVEQPSRVAALVAKWLDQGWARFIVFNLKLPMKKRLEEVARCREIISAVDLGGKPLVLRFKQLYHDREEVTGFAMVPSRKMREQSKRGGAPERPARPAQSRPSGRPPRDATSSNPPKSARQPKQNRSRASAPNTAGAANTSNATMRASAKSSEPFGPQASSSRAAAQNTRNTRNTPNTRKKAR
jgi:hypothetical protein